MNIQVKTSDSSVTVCTSSLGFLRRFLTATEKRSSLVQLCYSVTVVVQTQPLIIQQDLCGGMTSPRCVQGQHTFLISPAVNLKPDCSRQECVSSLRRE